MSDSCRISTQPSVGATAAARDAIASPAVTYGLGLSLMTSSMAQVAIVADDLTGALDTAGRWAYFGLRTTVMLSTASLPDRQAVAIHTASRAATAEQAYRRAKEAAQRLRDRYVYKKVDSTLRGNIGAEVEGLLDGLGLQRALLAPSFPAAGRTVQEGILRVRGVPVAATRRAPPRVLAVAARGVTETELGQDTQWPAHESHVPTLLARQTRRVVGHLPLQVVAQGEDAIRAALHDSTAELIVADAVEMEHLSALARAALHMPQPWLCCGSAGLAEGWLHALGLGRTAAEPFCWEPQAGPVLVVAGSRHPVTARQLRQAQEQRGMQLIRLALQEKAGGADSARAKRILAATRRAPPRVLAVAARGVAEGHHVALTTAFAPYRPDEEVAVAAHLARVTSVVCASVKVLGLILTGGDTADAVCAALGMERLEVVGEVQPGIPAVVGMGGQGDGLRLVTKAGGFGDDYALIRAIDFIQGAH